VAGAAGTDGDNVAEGPASAELAEGVPPLRDLYRMSSILSASSSKELKSIVSCALMWPKQASNNTTATAAYAVGFFMAIAANCEVELEINKSQLSLQQILNKTAC